MANSDKQVLATSADNAADNIEEDWEEWDGRSPFWIHCVAGSVAGVVEHTVVYPLDTVRTHIQVCASCPQQKQQQRGGGGPGNGIRTSSSLTVKPGRTFATEAAADLFRSPSVSTAKTNSHMLPTSIWQTIRFLINEPAVISANASAIASSSASNVSYPNNSAKDMLVGSKRLWRGVQTILIGCIPAHALYFSSYEMVKALTSKTNVTTGQTEATAWGSSLAGAAAVLSHDLIMTPLDTMKQRMQLGHYQAGISQAVAQIGRQEGWKAFYRSFPITLATNVPYGMVMVTTNEFLKQKLTEADKLQASWQTVLIASSAGGLVASAVTTPLDRIKTALQTQALQPACLAQQMQSAGSNGAISSQAGTNCIPPDCPLRQKVATGKSAVSSSSGGLNVRHVDWRSAASSIYESEGLPGFFRGTLPRVMSHTPAVAISCTTYEAAHRYLTGSYSGQ